MCSRHHSAFVGAFAHGYRGSAEATMGNETLVGLADALEVAADADGLDWRTPGVPRFPGVDGVATLASFGALRGDLIGRFAVDPDCGQDGGIAHHAVADLARRRSGPSMRTFS